LIKTGPQGMHDDVSLARRLMEREEDAVEDFVELYRVQIYEVAYRLTQNKEDALDLTQEVLVKAIEAIEKWDARYSLGLWVNRIALNHSLDFVRKATRRSRLLSTSDDAAEGNGLFEVAEHRNPFQIAAERELRSLLMRGMQGLSRKQRQIVLLRHFHALKVREISEVFRCSEGTIKRQLDRAYKKLRRFLNGFYGKGK
jgi:RNA polymerase sigma-70 factor (ECF subfamily)